MVIEPKVDYILSIADLQYVNGIKKPQKLKRIANCVKNTANDYESMKCLEFLKIVYWAATKGCFYSLF